MMRLARLGAALAALLAWAVPAAAGALVGIQDDRLPGVQGAQLAGRLDTLAALHAQVTRVDVLWADVAPTRPARPADPDDPAYRWERYDAILRGLRDRGIPAIVDFSRTPPWASRSGAPNAAPATADAAAFAGALAARYSGSWAGPDGRPLPRVRRIEVWNEPNLSDYWVPQCVVRAGRVRLLSPRAYAALLAAAYAAIKRASPGTLVVGGVAGPVGATGGCGTSEESVGTLPFAEALAREHAPLDAWSQHLYPIGSPRTAYFVPSWPTIPLLARLVDKLRPGAPIYVTETGYHTSYNRFHRYFVSEAQQAAWVEQTWQMAARYPRVQAVVWFNVQDNPFWTSGLERADGSAKPALATFTALAGAAGAPAPDWLP